GIGETERKKTKQFTDSPIHPFTDSVRNSGGGDLEGASLQYAGAYRPLFLVRNGELSEIKGDRFSIGGLQIDRKRKFTNHTLDIQKGDSIYIFTDGFVDQFGGVKGKRFMSKRFKEFLQDIQDVNIREQGKVLDETIEKWRGNEEQIDDILVIGIRF
ncbi:MAG: SpoIIE family protein phosphatase, partial [Cytophagales bacterium]|nr:SpoIIE family protein phosphatase [Cytophagales bacterium]